MLLPGGQDAAQWLVVGSMTPRASGGGRGVGLQAVHRNADGTLDSVGDAVPMVGPMATCWHPQRPVLYAVDHRPAGSVTAVRTGLGEGAERMWFEPGPAVPTDGADPCHLAVAPSGRHLITANYSSGSLTVHALTEAGAIGAITDLVVFDGRGPDADRQEASHPHHVLFGADGREVLVTDLGADEVRRFVLDDVTGRLTAGAAISLPAGAGPRHSVALWAGPGGNGIAVVAELASAVFTVDAAGELGAGLPIGRSAEGIRNYPSAVVGAGRRLYVGNRGADTITVLHLDDEGRPALVAETPAGGRWPQDLLVAGDDLFVASQESDAVVAFRLDGSGRPTGPTAVLPIPSPASLTRVPNLDRS